MGVSFDQLKQHRRVDGEKPRGSKLKHRKKKRPVWRFQALFQMSLIACIAWCDLNILLQLVHSCSVLCFRG